MEFWNYTKNSKSNNETIFNLFSNEFLNIMLNSTIIDKK
jgi:hypothetical protein